MRLLSSYISDAELRRQIEFALAEDIGPGDITTSGALTERQRRTKVSAKLIARTEGILAGRDIFALVFTSVADAVASEWRLEDGERFSQDDVLAEVSGASGAILQSERTALNFIGKLSGIATLTRSYVSAVSQTKCKILDTRKTTPGWRALEKYAVNCGGGINHRLGLHDMVLIKENHIRAAGSITQAIENVRRYLAETKITGMAIEVEIRNRVELESALNDKVERILLDNQSPSELSKLVTVARELAPDTHLEASGNITLANVAEYAASGVDFISIGALTHSAKTADFSLLIT